MDFDAIEEKEKEYFARGSLLVVQYTRDGLADLIELYVKLAEHESFRDFINRNQHKLYHLCYNQVRCCKCSNRYELPKQQLINPNQLELLFDKNGSKYACHNPFREVCCSVPRKNITSSILDVTLASCLLFNCCQNIFWYSCLTLQNTSLMEFLNQNKHALYHLYDTSERCCQCPLIYKFPSETELIKDSHWKALFGTEIKPCLRHRKRRYVKKNICSVSATAGILVKQLDPLLSRILLEHCCSLWKTIEKLISIRDRIFADVEEAKIPENEFIAYKASLEYGIGVMARVCKKEQKIAGDLQNEEKTKIDHTKMVEIIKKQMGFTDTSRLKEPSFIAEPNTFKRQKLILQWSDKESTSKHTAGFEYYAGQTSYSRKITSAKRSKFTTSGAFNNLEKDQYGYIRGKRLKRMAGKRGSKRIVTAITVKDDIGIKGYDGVQIKDGFYKLNIVCDNFVVDCIVDTRMKNQCRKSIKEFQGFSGKSHSFFDKNNISKFLHFVNEKKSLLCQYILNHTNSNTIQNHILGDALDVSIINNDSQTAKFIGWKIARNFLKSIDCHVYDIWLASLCRCKEKEKISSWFCSTYVTLIVLVPHHYTGMVEQFGGKPIKQVLYHCKIFEEAHAISLEKNNLSQRELNIQCHVPGQLAEKLFIDHSRLTLVCPSEIKSTNFQDTPRFLKYPCVQLYCHVKGAIPIGEKHFPSELQGIPTDVIEGFPRFTSQSIRIGDSVTNLKVRGTLGGFCLFYGREAFLTCAHAMMDWKTLLSTGHKHHMQPESVHFQTGDGILDETLLCGKVVNHNFTHDNPREISTDVALIEIDNGISVSEDDYVNTKGKEAIHYRKLGLKSRYLHDGYIKTYQILPGRNLQVVCVGAVSDFNTSGSSIFDVQEKVLEREELQSASNSLANFITENLESQVNSPVHMQVHAIVCASRKEEVQSQRTLRFYNQLAVNNIPFKQGDSGACVYITDGYFETGCLGMAIADFPGGGCIVTPMATLLEKLGLI